MIGTLCEHLPMWIVRCWAFLCLAFTSLQGNAAVAPEPPSSVVIASYNVENYLMMPRWINGHFRSNAGKPLSEKKAVANVLAGIHPDIIGLMEIGDSNQLQDLQRHLHTVGLDYPYSEQLQGWDTHRQLALLSRFPIVERHSRGFIPLQVNGETLHSSRGFLDVTMELSPGNQLRILCVHLKSKIGIADYNEEAFREAEAEALHTYVEAIIAATPNISLLVMGDFNDTKNNKSLLTLLGKPHKQSHLLTALPLKDDRGESWTEYWKQADEYSRIDYMMVTPELAKKIQLDHSGIARPLFWNDASDHCALFATLQNSKP